MIKRQARDMTLEELQRFIEVKRSYEALGEAADEVARLVIGIAARNDEHMQVITRLTNALDEPGLIDRLASTQDPQEFLDLLGAEQAA